MREVVPDEDPDISFLEQDEFSDRLRAFKRGEFGFVGVRAAVDVKVPTDAGGYSTIHRLRSAGLWNIEDDSGDSYLNEVFAEEREALIYDIERMGMRVERDVTGRRRRA